MQCLQPPSREGTGLEHLVQAGFRPRDAAGRARMFSALRNKHTDDRRSGSRTQEVSIRPRPHTTAAAVKRGDLPIPRHALDSRSSDPREPMHIRHPSIQRFTAKGCPVAVYPDKLQMGEAAATLARRLIRAGIAERGLCRIVVDDATSQTHVIAALTGMDGIEWSRVEVFQSNEYVGLAESHPASFRRWVKTRIADRVRPKATHYLHGDAPDPAAECDRYGRLLAAAPIDLCFVGFGDNAHIAFNDPHSADFNDPKAVKRVRLDERCRMQQVGEERFPSLRATPLEAVTLTCPTLLRTGHIISCVPDFRKANAVKDAIEGPRSTRCPASLVLTHPDAHLFLDTRSAALLEHRGDVS